MKKILAIMLVMLMTLPVGIISVSAEVEVPAEPVASSNAYVLTAYDYAKQLDPVPPVANITNDGQTLNTLYRISAFSAWLAAINGKDDANSTYAASSALGALKDGGYFVIVGKALAGLSAKWNYEGVIAATTTPLVITAKDPTNGTNYTSMKDGDIYYMNEAGKNDGQYGMFMMDSGSDTQSNTLIFEGDVIFENVVILNRTNADLAAQGKLAPTISAKSKIVIDDTVQFASMKGEQKYTLDVQAGAYAYLHALGFGKYTGRGTIVIGDEIINDVTPEMFADFDGTIVDKNGNDPFAIDQPPVDTDEPQDTTPAETEPAETEPADTTPAETKPAETEPAETEPADTTPAETEPAETTPAETEPAEDTEEPGNAPTGDTTWLVAVVAAASVIACVAVMVLKKRELN